MSVLTICCTLLTVQEPAFEDPAPPKVVPINTSWEPADPTTPRHLRTIAPVRALADDAVVEDWPQFHGPRRDAVSRESPLVLDWPEEGPRKIWEFECGAGYAAPSVLGRYLVFQHRVGDEEVVDCLDAVDGRRYWSHRSPTGYRDAFGFGNGPKCSPALTGERAFVLGVEGMLHCLHLPTGQVLWKRDLRAEFQIPEAFFGVGASPLVWNDLLVVNLGPPDGPCVVAFDQETGRLAWGAGRRWYASYASPIVANIGGRDHVLVFGGGKSRPPVGGLTVVDARSGRLVAEHPWRSRVYYSVNAATPVVDGGRILLSESYGKGGLLLELTEAGALREVWTNPDFDLHFGTAQLHEGHLYGFAGQKQLTCELSCVDFQTGKERFRTRLEWEEEVPVSSGTVRRTFSVGRAFLLRLADTFLCLGEDGHLLRLDLTPSGCEVRQRHWLFAAQETWTPLVLSRGLLYVCQNNRDMLSGAAPRLICYDLRGQ